MWGRPASKAAEPAPAYDVPAAPQLDLPDPFEGLTGDEVKTCLADPEWRLAHLYYILDKDGRTVLFKPNEVQRKFIDDLWYRNVVPKARQRGFSTVVQLMILDACLFVGNTMAAIIAQDEPTAKLIRDNKIIFAYNRLPETIRRAQPLIIGNVTELQWANGSTLMVSNSTRSMTLQWLHVSEYGIMCKKAPDKADEVQSGSLPSVAPFGICVVESTVEGTEGNFADMVRRAEETDQSGRKLSNLDYRLHFASWWDADEYQVDPESVVISPRDHACFERLEAIIGRRITLPRRAWYVATRDIVFGGNDEKMYSQYPSTLAEAFAVSTEGVWLSNQLSRARLENRITSVPYDPALPVNTFWDIGLDDDIAIWFHQQAGPRNHFIDFYEINNVPYSVVVRDLQARGYVWGRHYLPHDGDQRRPGAEALKTPRDMLMDLGLRQVEIVPRIAELILGINQLREAFATYWFDAERCKEGVAHLGGYQKVWNQRHGRFIDEPLKNGHQHAADALREHAQFRHEVKQGGVSGPRQRLKRRGAMAR